MALGLGRGERLGWRSGNVLRPGIHGGGGDLPWSGWKIQVSLRSGRGARSGSIGARLPTRLIRGAGSGPLRRCVCLGVGVATRGNGRIWGSGSLRRYHEIGRGVHGAVGWNITQDPIFEHR